ncbi:serine hydrolase domain-containing protein [Amycolatopsis sp. CA-230715]|uniref:serine hydrolase domain-containing protein n=1 Tax=Amycolatopsis sp. CA-230715 TaxID=2745196 RepID=UPI001C01B2D4|nr:serine hydrolase domain-containing protein [Amycolatopsis sp. CA-230715]QWF76641.1 D-alanyl-D-alanine carboxypeptidase [Amycolatopsis sp. CA-230715]
MKFSGRTVLATTAAVAAVAAAPAVAASTPAGQTPVQILQAGADLGTREGFPGVIGLVRNGDDTQYAKAGLGDTGKAVPADPKAQVRIGSNTKAFTAVVLLQLEGEGKLSLDDPVAKWLPGAIHGNGYDGTKITVRELLHQTSGLFDYLSDPGIQNSWLTDANKAWAPQALVDAGLAHPPTGKPGEKWAYSNTNFVLAGMVIQAVTGNAPGAEITTRVIERLGLHGTTFPADPQLHGTFLRGYFIPVLGPLKDVTASNVQIVGAAGAIVSTMDDLATFERALVTGQLLQPRQQQELKTTVPTGKPDVGYGLGIGTMKLPCGKQAWTHSGGVLGYNTTWLTSDDGKQQTVIAGNEYNLKPGKGSEDISTALVNAQCAI